MEEVPTIPLPPESSTLQTGPPRYSAAIVAASQPQLEQPLAQPQVQDSTLYESSGGFGPEDAASEPGAPSVGLWGILFSVSLLLLILASRICDCAGSSCSVWGDYNGVSSCSGPVALMVSVSLLSMLISGAMVFQGSLGLAKHQQYLVGAVWVLWTVGTIVATFDRPWKVTGNGYYASWIAWAVSAQLLHQQAPSLSGLLAQVSAHHTGQIYAVNAVLFAASLFELVAACYDCAEAHECKNETAYAVAVGVVSVLLTVLARVLQSLLLPIAASQVLWWIPASVVLTFKGPFLSSGNGYFATWVALMAAIHMLSEALSGSHAPRDRADSELRDYSDAVPASAPQVYAPPKPPSTQAEHESISGNYSNYDRA